MLLIRELKKNEMKTALHGHAGAGKKMSLQIELMFQTVVLPDAQKWLML
jgi:hypothetical protein